MTTSMPNARYKRCPKCQAMLRVVAEFCPHCGLSIPRSFPHKPLLAKDTLRIVSELKENIVPRRPTRAQTGVRYVVLVAGDRRDLFDYLRHKFATEDGIEVCYERRLGERRRRTAGSPGDRRRGDRRTRPPLDAEFRRFGFAIVRVE
jgi:zinc ribbon protein